MELKDAINNRRSIRGFLDKPVSREVLQQVLTLGVQAASRVNAQPWQFAVVTGEVLDQLREDNVKRLREKLPPDKTYFPYEGVYQKRRVDSAKRLFKAMDIAREDTAKRDWWTERGYRFFEAPAAILLYMDADLDETTYRLDMGAVMQNICLAAMEYGLGTCAAEQAVYYQKGLREYLGIDESKRFVIGIAIGYPDPDFPANAVVTPREDVDSITKWYGFEE